MTQCTERTKRPRQPTFVVTPLHSTTHYKSTLTSLLPAPVRVLRPRHSRLRYTQPLMAAAQPPQDADDESEEEPSDENSEALSEEMAVFRKGKRRPQNGELLPFDVSIVSPPPTYLGRFQLDPHTHCGDVVEHDGHQFVVKRVCMQYKYSGGGYRVIRKTIEVNSLARKALESYLERVWNES